MKVCYISEYFSPLYGGQFTAIKGIIDICKFKKIKYVVIHKKSKIYSNKKILEKTINKCDIVHIFGGWTPFYIKSSFIAHKLKKKIIIHPMGFYEPWSLSQKRMKKYLAWNLYQKKMLLNADFIHCASVKEEQNLKRLNSNFKTTILPFGIDQKDIVSKISTKIKKRCLFFSRLHKGKGLDKLLKAWVDINNKNWNLDIIGFGNEKYYKKLYDIKKYKKIRFLKPFSSKNRKFKTFEKYDLLVLPSTSENFGFVVLEALARGLPVLTTNGTPWNIIQDKNAGWIINNSLIELKLALHQIFGFSKKELINKKKNTIKIAKKFTKENLSGFYYKTYKKMLKN